MTTTDSHLSNYDRAALMRGIPQRKIEWQRAWRALKNLVADSERTDQVFEIVRALSGGADVRNFARLLDEPEGPRLLAERPDLLAALDDREALARLPEGSLGRAYLAFMIAGDLTAGGLVDASMQGDTDARMGYSVESTWFFDRIRDMHDVWHVLTGYGRDEAGEAANLAFTFAQTGNYGIGLIVLTAALIGSTADRFYWQRYLFRAWRRGRRARWLPAVRYERLLAMPLDEVRARLGIDPPEIAHPEGIMVANREEVGPTEKATLRRTLGEATAAR
jgi:ubiquinone biosynthesis protein COQ4